LALSAALSILSPYFLTLENLLAIGLQMSVVAIMAVGQVLVIISGGVDLSVGSVLAISGVVATMLLNDSAPMGVALLAGVLLGSVCGALNGLLITKGQLPPFIATLGMMGVARGAALILTGGVPIFGLPPRFAFLGGGRVASVIPFPVLVTLVLAVFGHILLSMTRLGRYAYAIGGNLQATRLSGVNVDGCLIRVYALCGFSAGLAGILLASRLNSGQPTAGTGYELDVIAACVIGGASLSGGQGTVLGAMVGALIMGILRNGCNLLDISAFWQMAAIGAIILVAVFYDQRHRRRRE